MAPALQSNAGHTLLLHDLSPANMPSIIQIHVDFGQSYHHRPLMLLTGSSVGIQTGFVPTTTLKEQLQGELRILLLGQLVIAVMNMQYVKGRAAAERIQNFANGWRGSVTGWGRERRCEIVDDKIGDVDNTGDKSGRTVSDDRGGAGSYCELGKDEGLDRNGVGVASIGAWTSYSVVKYM